MYVSKFELRTRVSLYVVYDIAFAFQNRILIVAIIPQREEEILFSLLKIVKQ